MRCWLRRRILLFDEPSWPASIKGLKDRILPAHLERIQRLPVPMVYVTHSAAEVFPIVREVDALNEAGSLIGAAPGDLSEVFQTRRSYRLKHQRREVDS